MTMDVGNNVSIPNGNLGVTGSTNLGAPTNTSGRLNIENAGNAAIQIRSGGSIQMRPTANDFDWRFKQEGSSLNFYQGADLVTPVVEMKQAGVEIDGALDVTTDFNVGDAPVAGVTDYFRVDGTGQNLKAAVSHSATALTNCMIFYNGNGQVGTIRTLNSATEFNTSSDPRLKSEFTPITGASEMILEARDQGLIGEFHFLSEPTRTVWGYNAHKLIDAQPNFGGSEGEGSRDAPLGDDVTPAGVDQSKRVPILEAAIGELLDRIRVLENA